MTIIIDCEMMTAEDLKGMITPYTPHQVRGLIADDYKKPIISYGQGSAGYDIRMAPAAQLFVAGGRQNHVNPKRFDKSLLADMKLTTDETGSFFSIPPHGSILTSSVESFAIPPVVFVECIGKSTYARCGLIVNITPLEPAWRGYLTIEIANTTHSWVDVYANEGIAQLIFHRLPNVPMVTYADRGGKYQGQQDEIVTARA